MLSRTLKTLLLTSVVAGLLAPAALAKPVEEVDISFTGRGPAGGEANAEIAAFDPASSAVYATNADDNTLDLYDFSDPSAPTFEDGMDLSSYGDGPNSVAYSGEYPGGLIAVAIEASPITDPGVVQLFDDAGDPVATLPAGALPDMVTFAGPKDRYLLVANEGEPADDGSADPEGSVTVYDLKNSLTSPKTKTAKLTDPGLLKGPVRIYTPGATQAEDLEPEYITTDEKGKTAYVSIQEANAIGILDIKAGKFKQVRSLGFKDWGEGDGLDASDEDGPLLETWDNLYGMYQPDAVASYPVVTKKKVTKKKCKKKNGKKKCKKVKKTKKQEKTYVVTANEGDARDWSFFSEEERVKNLPGLDDTAFPGDPEGDDNDLGRLNVTTTLGNTDADPEYEELYTLGGRSMSILDEKGKMVYDTGSELEAMTLLEDPLVFNADNDTPAEVDNRSDNKGPEPEAVATGKIGKTWYAFVGLERQGGIVAYDLSAKSGKAKWAGYLNTREDDLGPEGLSFIDKKDSPTGKPMLLVTYEISGTVAAYEVGKAS